jgi:predicted amidohydrolase YtcJ
MLDPYSDIPVNDPRQKNDFAIPLDIYQKRVQWLDKEGFQLYTHAIGDRSVREALNAYEKAMKENDQRLRRHRIEHIEQINPADLKRFRPLGILPSMQPIHADPGTVEVWSKAVGTARLPLSFAWASFLNEGNTLVFGSDWPACIDADPLHGLHVAVNRKTTDGKPLEGWVPEQRLTIDQALKAYTLNGSIASFEEQGKGQIREGMLADVVVLSQDLFLIDPLQIHATKVDLTVVGGKIVYERIR